MQVCARLFVILLISFVFVASASADQGKNTVRFGAMYISPTGDYRSSDEWEAIAIEADAATGLFVGYERRLSDLIGLNASVARAEHDLDGTLTDLTGGLSTTAQIGDVSFMHVTVGINFHFLRRENFDLYAGPEVLYYEFGDLDLVDLVPGDPNKVKTKNGPGVGAIVGIDVPLGSSRWVFSSAIEYLSVDLETDEPILDNISIGFDPWTVSLGVGVRF